MHNAVVFPFSFFFFWERGLTRAGCHTVLVYFSTWYVSLSLVEESNIYAITAMLSKENKVFNATYLVQNIPWQSQSYNVYVGYVITNMHKRHKYAKLKCQSRVVQLYLMKLLQIPVSDYCTLGKKQFGSLEVEYKLWSK